MLGRIWKDPVWSAVIAAGVVPALTYLLGWWPRIFEFATLGWQFLFESSALPNWLLGIAGLLIITTVVFWGALLWSEFGATAQSPSDWRRYREDEFFGLRWRWRWSYSANRIDELRTFCPHCDFQVFAREDSPWDALDRISFSCDSCHSKLREFPESYRSLESKTERFIQQKVRNGSWPKPETDASKRS